MRRDRFLPGMSSDSQLITISDRRRTIGSRELIALLAMLMSGVALAIDIMLPAFGDIRAEFGLADDSTAVAGLVTMFLFGLAVSQVFFGVLSDRFGRKPILYVGIAIYVAGAAASMLAPTLGWLLAGRFVWGIGAAAPRMTTLSVLRDTYTGERMARALSFVMAIFILVPIVAPSIGAVLTDWGRLARHLWLHCCIPRLYRSVESSASRNPQGREQVEPDLVRRDAGRSSGADHQNDGRLHAGAHRPLWCVLPPISPALS